MPCGPSVFCPWNINAILAFPQYDIQLPVTSLFHHRAMVQKFAGSKHIPPTITTSHQQSYCDCWPMTRQCVCVDWMVSYHSTTLHIIKQAHTALDQWQCHLTPFPLYYCPSNKNFDVANPLSSRCWDNDDNDDDDNCWDDDTTVTRPPRTTWWRRRWMLRAMMALTMVEAIIYSTGGGYSCRCSGKRGQHR